MSRGCFFNLNMVNYTYENINYTIIIDLKCLRS